MNLYREYKEKQMQEQYQKYDKEYSKSEGYSG